MDIFLYLGLAGTRLHGGWQRNYAGSGYLDRLCCGDDYWFADK